MYKSKESGCAVYETLEELLNQNVILLSKYEGFYYIKLKPECLFDNGMWKVDVNTKDVMYMDYTQYILDIEDKARPVELESL